MFILRGLESMLPTVTRNTSGDEIANVNFVYDNIVHALILHRFNKYK